MAKTIIDKIPRVIKSRKKLEKALNVKITNRGKEIDFEGAPEDEYVAEKVLEAIDFGFPINTALLIKEEDYLFDIINIKDHTNQKNLERVRGRIIGKNGKTLKTISGLSKCFFEIKDNSLGIIGDAEFIQNAKESAIALIKGSKQANVYAYLEKHHYQPVIDLGLKDNEKKKISPKGQNNNFK